MSTQRAISLFPGYQGYLFAQDDVVFNVHRMVSLNRSRVWTVDEIVLEPVSNSRYYSEAAMRESGCTEQLDGSSGTLPRATHDYVPSRLASEFARLTRVFCFHRVESEAAGVITLSM
jgi:hypothetical protein